MTETRNLHHLAEERSIAYHQAIADRLRAKPEFLDGIRQRLKNQLQGAGKPSASPSQRYWAKIWLEIIEQPFDHLLEFMVERSDKADQLRQSTPFTGILSPRERWAIHREVREKWLRQQRHESVSA